MGIWVKGSVGRAAALALMVAAAACSPRPEDDARKADAGPRGATALSAFLAGRFAQAQGDTRAAADYFLRALKHDPENADLLQRAFNLMVAEGRLDEAVPLAHKLLAFDADAPIPLLVAGVDAANQGRFAQAEAHFAAIPKKGFNAVLSPLLAAWSRVGQGRTDAAVELLAPLASTPGMQGLQAFHLGLINDVAERAEAAEAGYKTALAGHLSIRSVEAAGAFYQRAGKPEAARALYDKYEAEHPDTMLLDGDRLLAAGTRVPRAVPDARAGLAQALFDTATLMRQSNALDLALMFSRLTLAAQPDFVLAKMTIADILSAQKRLAEANAMYAAIDKGSPAHAYGRLRIAVNLDDMGDTDGAVAALDRLAADSPTAVDALVAKGDILRSHQRFEDAAAAYSAAIARLAKPLPRHWLLYFSRGIAFERSNLWPKAEADFKAALDLKPDQPDVLNYLGYSWVDRGLNLIDGRTMIEKAVQLRPKDGAIVDSLGWALYRMGDFVGAVKQLERAVELKPEDPTINDHLGDAYWQVGRGEEALFQWRRALSLDPDADQIDAIRAKVENGAVPAKPLAH